MSWRPASVLLTAALSLPGPAVAQIARLPATPRSSASAPLTVGAAVAEALDASPVLRAARTRADGARQAAPWTGRLPNPSIQWLGEGLRSNPPTVLQPDHGVSVVQSLPLGGRLAAERRLAVAVADTASVDVEQVREDLTLDVVVRVVDTLRALQAAAVVAEQRDDLEELVRVQQRRVDEGVGTLGDLGRLQAERSRVQLRAARLQIETRRARLALCAVLGRATCDDVVPVLPDASWATAPAVASAVGVSPDQLATRVETRPAVRAARARVDEARFAQTVAEKAVWPSLDVTAGYKRTQFLDTGMAGLSIGVPIFDRQRAPRARAAAAVDAATFSLDAARIAALAELQQAVLTAATLNEQLRTLDPMLPAQMAHTAARSAFREGASDVLRLLDAEQLITETRLDALALSLDAVQATLHAHVLLGLPLP